MPEWILVVQRGAQREREAETPERQAKQVQLTRLPA